MEKKLLLVEDVAEILNLSVQSVYTQVREGIIPAIRIGRQLRFDPDKLQEWMDQGGTALPGVWKKEA
ncbi:DNA binding domain protein, excisionase family [[Clostridium] ultunense Esp]|nr:DNA binding domain protein, excisionase family [[Clostridium] ultunense Esp]